MAASFRWGLRSQSCERGRGVMTVEGEGGGFSDIVVYGVRRKQSKRDTKEN